MENKIKIKKEIKVIFNSGITSPSRFLSNFLKYSFLNFLLFYLYNIFTICNSLFFKSFSSAISSFSCCLTSVLNLFSNSTIIFFIFSKSSSLSYILFSTVNTFHYTKYFITPLIFFYLEFFLPPILWLYPPLLILILLLSALPLVFYTMLFN